MKKILIFILSICAIMDWYLKNQIVSKDISGASKENLSLLTKKT
jgi:hypothetical protein